MGNLLARIKPEPIVARKDSKPLTILHVEDDDNDAILLGKACERAKLPAIICRVAEVEQAKAYMLGLGDFLDRQQFPLPQIVVLDLKLPGVNGLDFLNWLRALPEFANLPVLIFTSSLSRHDHAEALAHGASSYFVKPASFEALVQMVNFFQLPDAPASN
jgi:DNA-binding response OmpR family regulator